MKVNYLQTAKKAKMNNLSFSNTLHKWVIPVILVFSPWALSGQYFQINADTLGKFHEFPAPAQFLFTIDQSERLVPQEIPDDKFKIVEADDSKAWRIPPRQTGWFRFTLENTGKHDSLKTLVRVRAFVDNLVLSDEKYQIQTGGSVNRDDRAIPDFMFALPLALAPRERKTFTLGIKEIQEPYQEARPFYFSSPAQMVKEVEAHWMELIPMYFFSCGFFAVILYVVVFSMMQFNATKDWAYLFYSLYLSGLFLYYFKKHALSLSITAFSRYVSLVSFLPPAGNNIWH